MEDRGPGRGRVGWKEIVPSMRVVRLTAPLQALVPLLGVPSLSKSTRAFTLFPGKVGGALGVALMGASAVLVYLLYPSTGIPGAALTVWLLGTAGAVTFAAALKPTAFVKPICARCRLLPVIKEHEAIHLTGVASERAVWRAMRERHSVESLGLEGDPAICSFCPIPKRLAEH